MPKATPGSRRTFKASATGGSLHLSLIHISIVVANILANPLKLLAPALLGRVAAHGALVLSGVLARQADEVIAVYKAADTTLVLSVWR